MIIESQLINRKKNGDIIEVAIIMGVTRDNAAKLLTRDRAKRHKEAIEVLQMVIESRELLRNSIAEKSVI